MTLPKRGNFETAFKAAIAQLPNNQPNRVSHAAVIAFAQAPIANANVNQPQPNVNQQNAANQAAPMDVENIHIEEQRAANENNPDQPPANNPRRIG